MTFDRKPDLDNANVGMPDEKFRKNEVYQESYQIGSSLFFLEKGGNENPLLWQAEGERPEFCI